MTSIPLGCISLPVYNANGVAYDSVSGVDRFTFTEGALPTDGSLAFAVVRIDPAFSSIRSGATQVLAFYTGLRRDGTGLGYTAPGNPAAYATEGWRFISI